MRTQQGARQHEHQTGDRGLVSGFQHVATITDDLDGYVAFYEEIFGARAAWIRPAPDARAPFSRHALIEIAPGVVLHPFERPGADLDAWGARMLDQGRLDHFAVRAADRAAFEELRARLVARGASDGEITDFRAMLSVHFVDPSGTHCEVCWVDGSVALEDAQDPSGFRPRTERAS